MNKLRYFAVMYLGDCFKGTHMNQLWKICVFGWIMIVGIAPIHAETIIAEGGPHVAWNGLPFSFDGRYQQLYSSSFFSDPVYITSLSFAPYRTGTFTADMVLKLSHTTLEYGDLTEVLDDNVISPQTIVINQVGFSQSVVGGFKNNFSFTLDFSALPFSYDPRRGNLLIDLTLSNVSYVTKGFHMSRSNGNGLVSRAWDNANVTAQNADLSGLRTNIEYSIAPAPTLVTIDILPGSEPNCLNINGHGVVPVAILGSENFDVYEIVLDSLFFGGLETRVRGKKGPLCSVEYSNEDAYLDLVCKFEDDTGFWNAGDSGEVTLTGELIDSTSFEGTDSICVDL